jgi:GT2 family glycosyltransferase
MSLNATLNTTNHIINDIKGNKEIIIVDNASPNDSGSRLKDIFSNVSNVKVILNEKNYGFAIGSNIGYQCARKCNPEYIVLLNNDIEIINNNFINQIKESYNRDPFDVLGPDVYVPEIKIHQNPKKMDLYDYNQVKKINMHNKKILNQNKILFYVRAYLKNISLLRSIKVRHDLRSKNIINNKVSKNIVLHGSILIFSRNFINKIKKPFNEKTFFYFETEILGNKIDSLHLVSKYDPSIKVLHHQNTATRETFKNAIGRQKFQVENMIKSTNVFLELFSKKY